MKCLPHSKLPSAHGNILHDWHAEVLAIRAFNRFLLDQCLLTATPPYPPSEWLRSRTASEHSSHEPQTFTIRDDVQIHMYCSEAPCGDASMELVMSAQEDATPWTSPPPILSTDDHSDTSTEATSALRGRSNFSHLGSVRYKPSRPDAPPTHSKSCADKLALKQGTSLLSSLTSSLIHPSNAYIATLILPESQHVQEACDRAFSQTGRLASVSDERWKGGYTWLPFTVTPTSREFAWSRRNIAPGQKAVPSNLSAVYTPAWQETLIGGVLQGRKQLDPRGASAVCRRSMWNVAVKVAAAVGVPLVVKVVGKRRYEEVKGDEAFDERRRVKEDIKMGGLKGWKKNAGDEDFALGDGNGVS
jgi:tRNA-specific adenosine deaminase 1